VEPTPIRVPRSFPDRGFPVTAGVCSPPPFGNTSLLSPFPWSPGGNRPRLNLERIVVFHRVAWRTGLHALGGRFSPPVPSLDVSGFFNISARSGFVGVFHPHPPPSFFSWFNPVFFCKQSQGSLPAGLSFVFAASWMPHSFNRPTANTWFSRLYRFPVPVRPTGIFWQRLWFVWFFCFFFVQDTPPPLSFPH